MNATTRPARREDERIVAGVAAGLGAYLRIDANLVRLAFVVLVLAGGLGLFVYLVAWSLMAPAGSAPRADDAVRPVDDAVDAVPALALALIVFGGLLLARTAGVWLGDAVVWPLALVAAGLAVLWLRPPSEREQAEVDRAASEWQFLTRLPPAAAEAIGVVVGTRRGAITRVVGGLALVVGGVTLLIVSIDSWRALRTGLIATVVVGAGVALALGPGLLRLGRELARERRERIRSEERADMAAHLHDSVLQTLALVQRRADDPREVVRLARHQERELRAWLLGGGATPAVGSSLGAALDAVAAEVEEEYGVPIEVVRVRDCPIEGLEPLVLASREAMLNAVRHSGTPDVSVFVEVEPDRASVFVRDRGRGFDPSAVPRDRGGIAASIVGRMERRGGAATVRSSPGEGTEVELVLPRHAAAEDTS